MPSKLFRPKAWLIGAGLIHFMMGFVVQVAMPSKVAEMGWGKGNAMPHDMFYEAYLGFMILPHAVVLLATAFLFEGVTQARIAALLGGSTLLGFVGVAVEANHVGYLADMGAVAALAPPILPFTGLTLAGVFNWKGRNGGA